MLALTTAPLPIAVALVRFPAEHIGSAKAPMAVLSLPVVLLDERIVSDGGVVAARGVAKERIDSVAVLSGSPLVLLERAPGLRWRC